MDNPEKLVTFGQQRKNTNNKTTQKTKTMSNTDSTNKRDAKGKQSLSLIRHPPW